MIVNTIMSLVFVGMFGWIRMRMRYDRLVSWGVFIFVGAIFFNYTKQSLQNIRESFSFVWDNTKIGDIIISFTSYPAVNYVIIPLFFLSLYAILNNNIFRYEERRSAFNSLIIMNFVSLSLLVCAENYIQLITAVFVSDILGYMVLKDVDASRRYVIYNFFADMCLFMIFALISGRLQSLDMHQLLNYNEIGRHKDFVSTITAVAIFIKMGCALFQSYLLDMSCVRFQRMSVVLLLFSPLSGIILLTKLHNILTMSDIFIYLYQFVTWSSFGVGCAFFIIKDNIQKKMVYLNMALIGYLIYVLQKEEYTWGLHISYIYLFMYFINFLFFKIYLYQNREINVSKMLNTKEINTIELRSVLIQIVLLANVFFTVALNIAISYKDYVLLVSSCVILLVIAIVLNHIYKSPHNHKLDYLETNPLRNISFVINFAMLLFVIYYTRSYGYINLGFIIIFMSLIALPQISSIRKIYEKKWLQNEYISNSISYYIIQKPLTYLSKRLWVIIDFIISERIITAAITSANRVSISLFFKINPKTKIAYIGFILLGIGIFLISFYKVYKL